MESTHVTAPADCDRARPLAPEEGGRAAPRVGARALLRALRFSRRGQSLASLVMLIFVALTGVAERICTALQLSPAYSTTLIVTAITGTAISTALVINGDPRPRQRR